jgi:hypothetical protein
MRRRLIASAWLGLALAALFFYPLAVALSDDIYFLQWRRADVVETAGALALLAGVFGAVVFATWTRSSRGAHAALAAISVLPMASLVAGVSRQLPFQRTLIAIGELGALISVLIGVGATAALMIRPDTFGRMVRRLVIAVSPVSIVVLATLAMSAAAADVVVRVDRQPAAGSTAAWACPPVLALLFDELSFYYVYDRDDNIRPELSGLSRFGAQATHYVSVTAPGPETLDALPSFLMARHVREIEARSGGLMERGAESELLPVDATRPDGLFGTARRLGFTTEMGGYYLAYCDMLGGLVDVCRSRSFYNVSSVGSFSLADPVRTTLILWPRQMPFGLLKHPPFARHQREMVAELSAFARRPIGQRPATFRFVHFSIPHLPYVFGEEGFDPPFNPLETSRDDGYAAQVLYVDRLVGELMDDLKRAGAYDGTTIVVLADHGYRFGGRKRDPLQIPFIVKRAGQQSREEVRAERQGEVLLREILQDSCVAPGARP